MKDKRVALVTGGGSGIGRSAALALLKREYDLSLVDINESAVAHFRDDIVQMGGKAIAIKCDVASESDVQAAVDLTLNQYGRLDALVSSAGIDVQKSLDDLDIEAWRRAIDVNLTGSFLFIKHVRLTMRERGYGRIVCVGSTSGMYGMGWPAYSAAKAGLHGLVLSSARELARQGVNVNLVVPGPIETPLTTELWKANQGRRAKLEANCPTGRIGEPDEVGGAIAFLASEEASYITGATLVVDGGFTSLLPAN